MINLTPHSIVIQRPDGSSITIPPSGTVARVEMTETVTGTCPIMGVPVIVRKTRDIIGLPEDGRPCLVSSMVAAATTAANVFAPDTGATAIRDGKGQVVSVTRLVAASD